MTVGVSLPPMLYLFQLAEVGLLAWIGYMIRNRK